MSAIDLINFLEAENKFLRARHTWQPIETCNPECIEDYLVWNGQRVTMAWLNDDGWHDSTVPDYYDTRLDPQPTHWMLLELPK